MRKTALLTGVAGLFLMTAPAFAQDANASATAQTQASATAQAQPRQLTLQPGTTVTGSDGTAFGKLEGVRTNAAGEQELTVRGEDGQVRAVALGGIKQEGDGVVVGWTASEWGSAEIVTDAAAPATPATPAAPAQPATPAQSDTAPVNPAAPAMPADPADPNAPAAPPVSPQAEPVPTDPADATTMTEPMAPASAAADASAPPSAD